MNDTDLEARYREYIRCLNERRFGELDQFVQGELRYNGLPESWTAYRDRLVQDVAAIPDLFFDLQLIVARGDLVSSRILFHCTPQHGWQGWQPNGQAISFAEHVIYRFHGGKIAEVWSLLDRAAIAAQLA